MSKGRNGAGEREGQNRREREAQSGRMGVVILRIIILFAVNGILVPLLRDKLLCKKFDDISGTYEKLKMNYNIKK